MCHIINYCYGEILLSPIFFENPALLLNVGVKVIISVQYPLARILAKPNQNTQNFTMFKVQKYFILIRYWCDTYFLTCSSMCEPITIFLRLVSYMKYEYTTLQLLY